MTGALAALLLAPLALAADPCAWLAGLVLLALLRAWCGLWGHAWQVALYWQDRQGLSGWRRA